MTHTIKDPLRDLFADKVCPICKKRFTIPFNVRWAYKIKRPRGGNIYYCGWSCLCEGKRRFEEELNKSGIRGTAMLPKSLDGLEAIREARGMTKQDLACAVGVSTYMISMYESGGCKPSRKSLKKLTEVLGVSAEELMGRSIYDEI